MNDSARSLLTLPADQARYPQYLWLLALAVDDANHDAACFDPSPRRELSDDEHDFYVVSYTSAWWAASAARETKRHNRVGVWPAEQAA